MELARFSRPGTPRTSAISPSVVKLCELDLDDAGSLHRGHRAAPVTLPSDDRSPLASAYQWATRIMVLALEMVLPMLAGHWLDKKLGTVILFLLIGLALGCSAAVIQLMQIARSGQGPKPKNK